jgi:hypothetical protein
MADLIAHIEQANHNEECSNFLLANRMEARDWAITAAFYAAVHLVEACFTAVGDIGHTEAVCADEEPHAYRKRKVLELADPAYESYKKLYNASYHVRYLPRTAPGGSRFALRYYGPEDARRFVAQDLPEVRRQLALAFGLNLS